LSDARRALDDQPKKLPVNLPWWQPETPWAHFAPGETVGGARWTLRGLATAEEVAAPVPPATSATASETARIRLRITRGSSHARPSFL
jgi:hypothetical protein